MAKKLTKKRQGSAGGALDGGAPHCESTSVQTSEEQTRLSADKLMKGMTHSVFMPEFALRVRVRNKSLLQRIYH